MAWLAVLARLGRTGDSRAEADRRTLLSAAVLVPLMLVEFVASIVTLAVGCGETREPLVWHLGMAAAVMVAGAVTGAVRGVAGPRHEKTPAGGGRR